ncbi:MAG: RloB family protein, partial [Bacteroidota bacterium]
SDENRYEVLSTDEVWLVIDLDPDKLETRVPQIEEVIQYCSTQENWFIALSNPCFEVWLYYHLNRNKPTAEGLEICTPWKSLVNRLIPGGFDCRKHPILLNDAISNSEANYTSENIYPNNSETNLFKLGKSIYDLTKEKLNSLLDSK